MTSEPDLQTDLPTYHQYVPYPTILATLVSQLTYKPGWQITLEDIPRDRAGTEGGLTLVVLAKCYDSHNPSAGENYRVYHYFPVPPASYNLTSWARWLLDQLLLVERHEACEFFMINGERPFNPRHAAGNDPYQIFDPPSTPTLA